MDEATASDRPGLALRSLKEESSGIYEQVNDKAEKSTCSVLIVMIHKQEFIFHSLFLTRNGTCKFLLCTLESLRDDGWEQLWRAFLSLGNEDLPQQPSLHIGEWTFGEPYHKLHDRICMLFSNVLNVVPKM